MGITQRYILSLILITNLSSGNSHPTFSYIAAIPNSVVTLYLSDTQCQKLVPYRVSVPTQKPINSAVGRIIERVNSSDFSVAGYRVKVKKGVATVDLRVPPKSKRQLTSLSLCEQFALFGSIRKTLTSNVQWHIKRVQFMEKGRKIAL